MSDRYQDVYPESPLLSSDSLSKASASELLTLEFFEADAGEMPVKVFDQHHILVNLREEAHRVENWRDGEHRDFLYHKDEIIVTPVGVESGWKWHAKSKVIVITLEPQKLEKFTQKELGVVLNTKQLQSIPQFIDKDLSQAAAMLMDALNSTFGSDVMFESFARVFLTKLVQRYGLMTDGLAFTASFTSKHYQRVLNYVENNFGKEINIDTMAMEAGLSNSHFSRLFKQTIGQTPYQFVMSYRVEQAKKMLKESDSAMIDIALLCGFSDQAHFSRVFKQITGQSPKQWRK